MLIDGFFQSIKTKVPLNIDAFVKNYSKTNYGFNNQQADLFWQALKTTPYEVNQGLVSNRKLSVKNLQDSALVASKILRELKPLKNSTEFAHYVLMADIRDFYLTCMWVEGEINSPNYNDSRSKELLQVLNKLKSAELDKRFIDLNKDTFYLSELQTENDLRNTRLKGLLEKLENKK